MKEKNKNRVLKTAVIVALLFVSIFAIIILNIVPKDNAIRVSAQKEQDIKSITVGSAGDIMLHSPFYRSDDYKTEEGDYDFGSCFDFIKPIYSSATYMAVNLETTLAGKDEGYSGYPMFRSPDSIADSLSDSGVDLMLLANNHIYDSGREGFLRTSRILKEKGIDYTGARHSEDEKKYMIKDINGIKLGIMNFTYETPRSDDIKGINGNPVDNETSMQLNSFDPNERDTFYDEIGKDIDSMEDAGVDFKIVYLHWGEEYHLKESQWQRQMAQELCDMGVDALIGSHPHVVQPVDVFTGTSDDNEGHLMFCAFSLGNQLSNQRRELMDMDTGHTEDGLIIDLEIKKDKTGTRISKIDYHPTWVYKNNEGPVYYILPADEEANTAISDVSSDLKASYERTWSIIRDGAEKVRHTYGFD